MRILPIVNDTIDFTCWAVTKNFLVLPNKCMYFAFAFFGSAANRQYFALPQRGVANLVDNECQKTSDLPSLVRHLADDFALAIQEVLKVRNVCAASHDLDRPEISIEPTLIILRPTAFPNVRYEPKCSVRFQMISAFRL